MLVALTIVVAVIRRHALLDLWDQWDGRWYVGIALHGYHWGIGGKPALAFYPLYPLLIRCMTGTGVPAIAAALLIANGAFLAALFYLARLLPSTRGPDATRRALWLLSFLPTAFFFFAPYSESLFLLGAVGSLYHARRGQYLRSGLWTATAILARPTGIVVLAAGIAYLLVAARRERRSAAGAVGVLVARATAAAVPSLLGVAAYLWYLRTQHIALSGLLHAQRAWHRGLTFPWVGFTASIHWLVVHGASNVPWAVENVLQTAVTVGALALTLLAWRAMNLPDRVFCAGFWLIVLLSPEWQDGYYAPLSSMDRFVLVLFPVWAWVAARGTVRQFRTLVSASAALMLGAACVHLAGGWVG